MKISKKLERNFEKLFKSFLLALKVPSKYRKVLEKSLVNFENILKTLPKIVKKIRKNCSVGFTILKISSNNCYDILEKIGENESNFWEI